MSRIEVNAAPMAVVRLTNSRRVIRCIPSPPLRLSVGPSAVEPFYSGRLHGVTVAAGELLSRLTQIRANDPKAVSRALGKRRRRPLMERGVLFLIAAYQHDR